MLGGEAGVDVFVIGRNKLDAREERCVVRSGDGGGKRVHKLKRRFVVGYLKLCGFGVCGKGKGQGVRVLVYIIVMLRVVEQLAKDLIFRLSV